MFLYLGIRLFFTLVYFYMLCSNKFKSFSYLYDEEQFISFLKNDVIIAKTLPESLKAARKRNEFPLFKPKNSASPKFYLEDVLPKLKKAKVIGLIVSDGGCLQVLSAFLSLRVLNLVCSNFNKAVLFFSQLCQLQCLNFKD